MTPSLAPRTGAEALRGFAVIHGRRIETATILPAQPRPLAPHLVFLHGAFGSLSSWERFPREVVRATGCPALVYSRAGHGRSDPPSAATVDCLRVEALSVLPALLDTQGIARPLLVGHDDGAAIALIHAGGFDVAGVAALSPRSSRDAAAVLALGEAARRLAAGEPMPAFTRHHRDPAALLARWLQLWPRATRLPDLDAALPRVRAPVVLLQGEDDESVTLADLAEIARRLRGPVQSIQLEAVGDAPWQDAPRAVMAAIVALVARAAR